MSQYEMNVIYICGEDNCMADVLLHVPKGAFPDNGEPQGAPSRKNRQKVDGVNDNDDEYVQGNYLSLVQIM